MKAAPAIKSQMGSIPYYQTTITARELVTFARPARETDDWATQSVEERIQRDINRARIRDEIVPYLAKHPDRFFGSFIILTRPESVTYEPIEDVVGKIPLAYKEAVGAIGFLTITDDGQNIALDGQHRLVALRDTIQSQEALGPYQGQVGNDRVSVIVIEHRDNKTTRRIFNKVNRNAKPVGRADNILLSEDDGYAILSRWLLDSSRGGPLASFHHGSKLIEIVNWKFNTLTKRLKELTTLSAENDTVKQILSYQGFKGLDEKVNQVRPSDEDLDDAFEILTAWWDKMLRDVNAFSRAIGDPDQVPQIRFSDKSPYDPHTLLLRPVGQIAMVRGVIRAMKASNNQLTLEEALRRVNLIDWSANPGGYWRDVIMRADGRMSAREESYNLASELIAYLIGSEWIDAIRRDALHAEWNAARGRSASATGDPTTDPEDLPMPVA